MCTHTLNGQYTHNLLLVYWIHMLAQHHTENPYLLDDSARIVLALFQHNPGQTCHQTHVWQYCPILLPPIHRLNNNNKIWAMIIGSLLCNHYVVQQIPPDLLWWAVQITTCMLKDSYCSTTTCTQVTTTGDTTYTQRRYRCLLSSVHEYISYSSVVIIPTCDKAGPSIAHDSVQLLSYNIK